ncbi:sigma-70 family RNA polymerase sigma factor [Caulobacter soli]|uniref:sigma-70 family RNA polymerase sigma factor n=1 Tax=Caulobacter soli TaxID=2708539 RepID=UPI0013EB937F|nr:sigma-70 family RNA polymerase sigma factor [Caulobacter soli]
MDVETSRALLSRAIARVANRDDDALKYVYRHTSAKLFGVVLRILHDREEAEDVLQDVYLTVWNKAGRFDPEKASPITWLVAMARNRAIDRLRARGSRVMAGVDEAEAVPDSAPLASTLVETDEEKARLDGCIDGLEPKHASAVRTAFFEGLTYDALAQAVGVPLGTMKSWIRRALISLRACLEA